MHYRKFFEEYYEIEIPDGFEIHHADHNHNNNNIENLVMLPKELHRKYHRFLKKNYWLLNKDQTSLTISTVIDGDMFNLEKLSFCANTLLELLSECEKWRSRMFCHFVFKCNANDGYNERRIALLEKIKRSEHGRE